MKTFKLKRLMVMENETDTERVQQKTFKLKDGLVINREDENGWLIEAFLSKEHEAYFQALRNHQDVMIQVKITREDNDPAFFITQIIELTPVGEGDISVLFQGKIVDHAKSRIEEMLQRIIEEGYQGESLLRKFKESI